MTVSISGTDGVTFNDSSVQTTAAKVGMVNRIINGAMVNDQRNAGAATTAASGYGVDRFYFSRFGTDELAWSIQQDTSAPAGFINSQKVTITTAETTFTTNENATFGQVIEGLNIADLGWGTASAATVTLSFWVRSSLTGTFGGALFNSAANRFYPFSYTITTANTWEYETITIAGDTSGTWLTTNGAGIYVQWGLGQGPDRLGTAGAWTASNNQGVTGQVQLASNLNATWQVTGVQLEKGSTATSFDYRSIGTELALCQRYYYLLSAATNVNTFFHPVAGYTTTAAVGTVSFPQMLRTGPSLVTSGTASNYRVLMGGAFITCSSVPTIDQTGPSSVSLIYTVASGMTVGYGGNSAANGSTSAILGFSAEL